MVDLKVSLYVRQEVARGRGWREEEEEGRAVDNDFLLSE